MLGNGNNIAGDVLNRCVHQGAHGSARDPVPNDDDLLEILRRFLAVRLASGLREGKDTAILVEQIYLGTLSRRPTPGEMAIVTKHIAGLGERTKGLQDLQFALMNSGEFLLRH